MQEPNLTPAERELEAALGELRPAGHRIERDRLMFHAGQASVKSRLLVWRCTSSVLAVALGITFFARPGVPPVATEPYPIVRSDPAPAVDPLPVARAEPQQASAGGGAYLTLRRTVLAEGLDALPRMEPPAASAERPLRDSIRQPLRLWNWNRVETERQATPGASL